MSTNTRDRSKSLSTALALGLALVALDAGAADAPKGVMDYYQQIPKSLFPDDSKLELKRTKSGWITHSPSTDAEISATVDTKNGYIEFIDEGTGGGDAKTQVALFLKEDKSPLVAIGASSFDGVASSGKVAFVAPDGGQWKDLTGNVLPALRLEDFVDSGCLAAIQPDNKETLAKEGILYELPRQGTTIRATLHVTRFMLQEKFQNDEAKSPCPASSIRELKWDKKAGRFTLDPAKPAGKK